MRFQVHLRARVGQRSAANACAYLFADKRKVGLAPIDAMKERAARKFGSAGKCLRADKKSDGARKSITQNLVDAKLLLLARQELPSQPLFSPNLI